MHRWIIVKRTLSSARVTHNSFGPQVHREDRMISYIYSNVPTVSMMSKCTDEILENLSRGLSVRVICKQDDDSAEKQMRYFLHCLMSENLDSLRIERHVDDFYEGGLDFVIAPRKSHLKDTPAVVNAVQMNKEMKGNHQEEV
mmetsp:Transcript_3485/g.13284  ORF Transcript_3485/g.13284 Transcript_3485/m.13284 type:complete len:142 (-) Transcript_3485:79-504(-)